MNLPARSLGRRSVLAGALAGAGALLAGCGSYGVDPGADGETGTVVYWLWESAQLPAYQQCALDFQKLNPDIEIKIEQFGWDDYWNKLFTSFVGNSAPDVFANHTARYGEFAQRGLIVPIDEQVAAAGIDLDAYVAGTADLWVGSDGKRYGLPKDFDAVGLYYNEDMVADAGLSRDDLWNLDWNPDDGGSYEKVIARLTIDRNGKRGDEPGFDKGKIATYGLGLNSSGGYVGQTEWSYLVMTTGWTYMDKKAWGTKFYYDDPRFQQTVSWWRGLIDKGFMPPLSFTEGGSQDQQMQAGRYAMCSEGSWTANTYSTLKGVKIGLAPTPVGPVGHRACMQNSLADSISTSSQVKGAAWKWAAYLGSEAAQSVVAEAGVVMPALKSTNAASKTSLGKTGLDVSAYTDQIDQHTTFPYPAVLQSTEITTTMQSAMDNVMAFNAEPSSLTATNRKLDALFT
ncbi:ABC transporter substrate-binding protein [Kineococcus rhizosphaerae]|uniref:Carbohydrate ABC transporter substrate-binding protein (CUT1 family) n=1 Tax=Kineococcus rhizosphaerae TaxID=559628 RepID=A0A2T0R7M1_9ACTN|nr:sugar ABC transporter substrate-binding protein [Kineococcus rhizosphaerae]PRY17178.1 carbohydrate ABC transporter substrate-binding protein (CUT1 family) [Kineococcus rhizosphaerae]